MRICTCLFLSFWQLNARVFVKRGFDKLDDGYVSLLLLDPLGLLYFILSFESFVITASASTRTLDTLATLHCLDLDFCQDVYSHFGHTGSVSI